MKIGIFTDAHYASREVAGSKRQYSRSLQKIEQAYRYFKEEKCEMVICLGDLIDKEDCHAKEISNLQAIVAVLQSAMLSTVCLMGNHDAFTFEAEEFYSILGDCAPRDIVIGNKTLLFLDACYFKSGAHYKPGDSDWTDTYYPHVAWLENKLAGIEGDVYVFLHQNLDPLAPENHQVSNSDTVRRILEASGKVKYVYQGHYHAGLRSEHNGIAYVTLPAMCEQEDAWRVLSV